MAVVLSASFGGACLSTLKEKEMFLAFEYNHREYLTENLRQLQQNVRYRNIDSVDCIELIIAIERLNAFNEYCKIMHTVFNIGKGINNE